MMKVSKSWKMVVSTFIIGIALPFVNSHLPESSQISEEFANNFIYIFLGSAGIGLASKIVKTKKEVNADDNMTIRHTKRLELKPQSIQEDIEPATDSRIDPRLMTESRYYLTNFKKSDRGNSLSYGTSYLNVKLKGVRSYMTGQIFKGDKLIQIDQADENGFLRFELFRKTPDGVLPFEIGKYTLVVAGDRGTSDSNRITDEFEIV